MTAEWYVIRTEPRAEYLAAGELTRDGFEIFFPRVQVTLPRTGHVDTPLFPGYLFLRCDPGTDNWPTFRPGHRISGWVRYGGEIPSVPDEAVDELRQRLLGIRTEGGLWRRFMPGEKVQVVSGSMEGIAEVLEETKSPQANVRVLLQFMGGFVHAQVPWDSLRPMDNEPIERTRLPRRTRGGGRWVRGFGARASAAA